MLDMTDAASLTRTAPATRLCPRCGGRGREKGPPPCICGICHGRGTVPAPASRVPITHHADPKTSAMAEREITASGERDRQIRVVYEAVCAHPGKTARELANIIGSLDYVQISRRLPEIAVAVDGAAPRKVVLIERGPAKVVNGFSYQTWYPVGQAPKEGEAS